MWDFDLTTSLLKLVLAWGFVIILISSYVLCRLIAGMIQNEELISFVTKTGRYLLIFWIIRFFSSIIDFNLHYEITVTTYLAHYVFWCLVLKQIYSFYSYLKKGFYISERKKEIKKFESDMERSELRFSKSVSLGFDRQHRVSSIFKEVLDTLKFQDELEDSIN